MQYIIPVETPEEWVRLDPARSTTNVSQSPRAIDGAERADNVPGLVGDRRVCWEGDGFLYDPVRRIRNASFAIIELCSLFVDLERILVPKWRIAREKLVQ